MTNKVKYTGAALGIIGIGLAFLLLKTVLVVQIRLPRSKGKVVYSAIAGPDDQLCMRYIHSVERTPVQGWFALDANGGFRAVRTLTTGTGTGLPNVVADDRVQMEGKWMVVDENNTYYPEIPFYFLPLNNLRISVGDDAVDLDQVPPGSQLLITCTPMSLGQALLGSLSRGLGS